MVKAMAPTEPSLLTEGGSPGAEWKNTCELGWAALMRAYEVSDCIEDIYVSWASLSSHRVDLFTETQ